MTTTKKRAPRTGEIAAIHVLKTKLGLDEDTYRAMLSEVGGVTSAASLDGFGRRRVLDHLRSLERELSGLPPLPARPASPGAAMGYRADDAPRVTKIRSMWLALSRRGRVGAATEAALNAWLKRQLGVDQVVWLTPAQQNTAIEMLKNWTERD